MLQINNHNIYILGNSIWVLLPTIIYLVICLSISPYRQLFFFGPKWGGKKQPTVEEEPTQEELGKINEKIRGEMEEFLQENDEEVFDSCYKNNFPNDDPEDDKKTWWDRNKAKVAKAAVFLLLALLALFIFTYDTPPPDTSSSSSSSQLEVPNNPETQAAAPLTFEERREYRKYIRFFNHISVDLNIFQKELNQGVFEGVEIPYQITASITNGDYTKNQLESVTNPREKFELYKSFYDKRVSHVAYAMLRELNS